MTAKVHQIALPHSDVCEALAKDAQILMDRAKSGEVTGYAIMYLDKDGDMNTTASMMSRHQMMGCLMAKIFEVWEA